MAERLQQISHTVSKLLRLLLPVQNPTTTYSKRSSLDTTLLVAFISVDKYYVNGHIEAAKLVC